MRRHFHIVESKMGETIIIIQLWGDDVYSHTKQFRHS